MGYEPKEYGKVIAENMRDVPHLTHADEASAKWAAAFNYRERAEAELAEAMERHQKAVAEEHAAWDALQEAAGRALGQATAPLRADRVQIGRIA